MDGVATTVRGLTAAFLDAHLAPGRHTAPFVGVPASTDVYVNAYPLGSNPPIP